ncbi:hypothetical protein CRENPOLYSF2_4520001 [Crenothrix polyspora]|uniref:Lipoprotein n=1 Tax=Crenothrix polyspora TaxID=360316 RepID=A0A1R4HFN8_9GAMM|nr:hypothetical protein [Crenothrix polyspora]SJM95042.1 hypothetical protein CRENPOLYSF2_4520001 [Crenothrix polyspora]
MKILYLAVFVFLSLFAYGCSSKYDSTQPLAGINPEYLCQHWLHSREEEQQTDKDEIYRPKNFKEFPASHFRMQYIFYKNGDCDWFFLAPDDGHHFKRGKWSVDPKDKNILHITKDDTMETYRVNELTKTVMRIARINP